MPSSGYKIYKSETIFGLSSEFNFVYGKNATNLLIHLNSSFTNINYEIYNINII